jgi:hypothetical protein
MAGRHNRSRGWRRPAVVLARSSAYLPSIFAGNAVSVRGLRGLPPPTLWGAALRQRCDRNVQRPRLNLLLEHDHSPELAWLEHYPQIYMVSGEQCTERQARRCRFLRGPT